MGAADALDKRWKDIQDKFQAAIDGAIDNIKAGLKQDAEALGQPMGGGREEEDEKEGSLFDVPVPDENDASSRALLLSLNVSDLASRLQSKKLKKIVVLCGAGISTSCGIPDFRTKGTGLYDNLTKYALPTPQAIFDIDFFKKDPVPFFSLAKEMFRPGKFVPSITHRFISMLARESLLLRCYTQNIDGLELEAGLIPDLLVQCHGSFEAPGRCAECSAPAPKLELYTAMQAGVPLRCGACEGENKNGGAGTCKPGITFFGESLPKAFGDKYKRDMEECDCCIVLGSSLAVTPVSMLPAMVRERDGGKVPRVLCNLEAVGDFVRLRTRTTRESQDTEGGEERENSGKADGKGGSGVAVMMSRKEDLLLLGDCDAIVKQLWDASGFSQVFGVSVNALPWQNGSGAATLASCAS